MKVYLTMNGPYLDHNSARNLFMNTMASLSEKAGVRFHVVLPTCSRPIDVSGIDIVPLLGRIPKVSFYPAFFAKLIMYSRRFLVSNPDYIVHHFASSYRGLEAIDAPAFTGVLDGHPFIIGPAELPIVFTLDDFEMMYSGEKPPTQGSFRIMVGMYNRFLLPVLKESFKASADRCDTLIVVSDRAKKSYARLVKEKKIKIIPHGVDLGKFKFSQPPKAANLLFVGDLIRRKGVHMLIKCVSTIRKDYPSVKLEIIGEGPQKNNLLRLVTSLGLQGNVVFRGRVSERELIQAYRSCRIYCHPSLAEGWCHTTLEAMACGRPVVSTNTMGSSMVEDGRTGFLTDVGDSDAMAQKLLELLGDYDLTTNLGAQARREVEKRYDWVKISMQYLTLYQSFA